MESKFRFLPHKPGCQRQPIAISEREDGPSIIEKELEEYKYKMWLSKEIYDRDEPDGCSLPEHVPECTTSEDSLAPCTFDGERGQIGKRCRTESDVWHDDAFCRYSEGQYCFVWQAEFAREAGVPGTKAFKRLPEWLRRPRDASGLPLMRWMRNRKLIHDLRCVLNQLRAREPLLTRLIVRALNFR